jgi:hypothetical protein
MATGSGLRALPYLLLAVYVMRTVPRGDFRCVNGTFVAPARPSAQLLFFAGAFGFFNWGAHNVHPAHPIFLEIPLAVVSLALGLLALWCGIGSLTDRYRIVIGRDGVTLNGTFTREFVPWAEVCDPNPRLHNAGIRIQDQMRERGIADIIPLRALNVPPSRLAAAIAWYRDHPSQRGAIGNPAELARMT